MAMQCRRCPDKIEAGQIAHTIHNIIVCNNCLGPNERGYREHEDRYTPPPKSADVVIELTPRRLQLLIEADAGNVTKRAQEVSAHYTDIGKTINSKGVAAILKDAGLVYWEKLPQGRYEKDSPTWKLRLTQLGKDTLREARYTMKGQ